MPPRETEGRQHWMTWLYSGAAASSWAGEIGLLLARIYLGLTILRAGASKFPTINWFQDQVAGLGFPAPNLMAFVASASEMIGGALLIAGLCTRPAAFFAATTMGVAAFAFHKNAVGEMHIAQLFLWMLLLFALMGAGRLSLDALLRRRDNILAPNPLVPANRSYYALLAPLALLGLAVWFEMQPPTPQIDPAAKVEQVSLAGTFNSWSLNKHLMNQVNGNLWQVDFDVETPGEVEFKFVVNRDWRSNLGDTDQTEDGLPASGIAELDDGNNSSSNIRAYLPSVGSYRVTLDTETLSFKLAEADLENVESDKTSE